jgi:hypothetical protein
MQAIINMNIMSKVDGTQNARRTKIVEELGIPVTTLHTVMNNRKKIKTAKYEKVEAICMEWF